MTRSLNRWQRWRLYLYLRVCRIVISEPEFQEVESAQPEPQPVPETVVEPTFPATVESVPAPENSAPETPDDVEMLLKVSDATVTRYLNTLVLSARIRRLGSDGGAMYEPG